MESSQSRSRGGDQLLLVFTGILLVIGLIMITSIGVPKSIQLSAPSILYPSCDDPKVDCYLLLKKHIFRMGIGVLALFFAAKISYRFWRKISVLLFGITIGLLVLVLFLGATFNTFARSWISFFNTSFQPSEMAKLAMIFYLAYWCEKKQRDIATLHGGFIPFFMVVGLILLPILLQPDVGTAFIMIAIAISILFSAGAKIQHLIVSFLIGLVLACGVVLGSTHIRERFLAFLQPAEACRETYCWQSEQAAIAVGSGGFWGKGIAQGVQKSYWLPQASDDFIFAASAEELGFLRTLMLVLLYGAIAYRGYHIANEAPNLFASLTATGITTWITFQAFLNIAVNIGLFPITGVTLPFMSYGGSSLMSLLLAVGVLLNISQDTSYASGFYRRRNGGAHSAQSRSFIR
jgi:cell division protein FtsW